MVRCTVLFLGLVISVISEATPQSVAPARSNSQVSTLNDFAKVGRPAQTERAGKIPGFGERSATRFSAVRLAFQRSQQQAAEEVRKQSFAEAQRIRAAGGLEAYWRSQLARDRRPYLPHSSPGGPYRQWLSYLALCHEPHIFQVNNFHDEQQAVRVSRSFTIYGCKLGQNPGKVRLYSPQTGRTFEAYADWWYDEEVSISINPVSGITDQVGILQLETEAGVQTNVLPVLIQPMLDIQMIGNGPDHSDIQIDCADSTDLDGCVTLYKDPAFTMLEHSIGAYHVSECCFNSVTDTDHFSLNLKNGWVLQSVSDPINFSGIDCNPPYAGLPGKVQTPTGYTIGSASTTIDVSWWADANCSFAKYAFDIFATGPIGIPYR